MVDKLIEVANEFGFDGWFINQETDPTESTTMKPEEYAKLFQEFVAQYKQKAGENLELMWYDAMTVEGKLDWQNAFNEKNKDFMIDASGNKLADTMFLNFWWTTDKLASEQLLKKSNEYAKSLNVNSCLLYTSDAADEL